MAEIYMDGQTGVGVLDFGPSAKGVTEVYSLGALVGDEALRVCSFFNLVIIAWLKTSVPRSLSRPVKYIFSARARSSRAL